jgi:hypothetical protein
MLAQGPIPEVAEWTSLDVATLLRETILQASLQRTLQQANLPDHHTQPSVQEMWDRWGGLAVGGGHSEKKQFLTCFRLFLTHL